MSPAKLQAEELLGEGLELESISIKTQRGTLA